ncbi:MAG: hypothetical protein EOP53_08350 [Sphingobacteriales bacterium]|nr:MAG: hypothetical protein EOP53_08350 [Sphingobacteriales bacterium]
MIQIQHEEQYTLLVPSAQADKISLETLADKVTQQMEEGHKNYIIHLEHVKKLPADYEYVLENINQIVNKEDGLLIISGAPKELEEKLEEKEVITTPTLDEATDYIFMEEIEKQFRSEHDGEQEEWEKED